MRTLNPHNDYWQSGFENGRRIALESTSPDDLQQKMQEAVLIAVTMYYPIETFYEGLVAGVRSVNFPVTKDTNNGN